MLQSGEVRTAGDAARAVGISRSAFYKYKDAIRPFNDMLNGHIVTFQVLLKDEPDISIIAVAGNGKDLLGLLPTLKPDLILLDIQLPRMDGHTVARNLRNNPELSAIPIVAVTSYAMAGDREKALAAGCNGYIEKPINPDTFIQQVEQHLSGE